MQDVINKMQSLKKSVEQAQLDKATSKGRVETFLERLKKEHKQNSFKSAEAQVDKNKLALGALSKNIIEKFSKVEESYEF